VGWKYAGNLLLSCLQENMNEISPPTARQTSVSDIISVEKKIAVQMHFCSRSKDDEIQARCL